MKCKSCDHEEIEILDMKTIDKYENLSDYISHSKKFHIWMLPNVMWGH